MAKYALLCGINYFGSESQLSGCINDVLNIKRWLLDKRDFKIENIVLMTDDSSLTRDPHLRPTKQNILHEIAVAVGKLKPQDELFFHYSGHGSHSRDRNGDEKDGEDECICPVDMDFIYDDELKEILVDKIPKGAKLRVLMDCCHSATGLDLKHTWKGGERFSLESAAAKQSNDVLCISGCEDWDVSADAWINRTAQGAMTWAFLDVMARSVEWTWTEVITLMRDRLLSDGYKQVPQLSAATRKIVKNKVDI